MKKLYFIALLFGPACAYTQKIDSIYFNLYTDSLKKGVHNYINLDGKLSNGRYMPLTAQQVSFESTSGKWEGNDLILDKDCKEDSITIKAVLKENKSLSKTITIYIKKSAYEGELANEKDLFNTNRKKKRG